MNEELLRVAPIGEGWKRKRPGVPRPLLGHPTFARLHEDIIKAAERFYLGVYGALIAPKGKNKEIPGMGDAQAKGLASTAAQAFAKRQMRAHGVWGRYAPH